MKSRPSYRHITGCVFVFVALAVVGCAGSDEDVPSPTIEVRDGEFRDHEARQVMLRGVNIRAAGFFDIHASLAPLPSFTVADCEILARDFGMNVLRLAINWSLIEPERDDFDEAFFDRARALIEGCAEYGLWVLVDLHQDGYSRFVHHDGAPHWAHPEPKPSYDGSDVGADASPLDPAVVAAFQALFANEFGLRDEYIEMARAVAEQLGTLDGSLGIEIMNEPISPFDPEPVFAFYDLVAAAIRDVSPFIPIFFEPTAERNILDTVLSQPSVSFQNAVYAPHLYTGVILDNWEHGDKARIDNSLSAMLREAEDQGSALFVGEWGHNIGSETGFLWAEAVVELFDEYRVSSAFWVYEEWASTCGNLSEFTGECWGLYDTVVSEAGGSTRTGVARRSDLPAGKALPQGVDGRP